MQTTSKPILNWLLTGGLMLGLAATSPAAVTTIADSFSLNGSTRTAGAALGGLITEVGGATWVAKNNNLYFTSTGSVTPSTTQWDAPLLSVALPAATGIVTMSVDVNSYYTGQAGQWSAIGFLNNTGTGWWSAGSLWAYTKFDGGWAFYYGTTNISSGNYTPVGDGFRTLSISYDPNANQAKFSIDGVTKTNWTTLSSTPGMGAASMYVQSSMGESIRQQFDNFVVTVPEPASLGLLLLAGGLLAGRRRHQD